MTAGPVRPVGAYPSIAKVMMNVMLRNLILGALLAAPILFTEATARAYILPPSDIDIIGTVEAIPARQEDTLLDIAREFDIGQEEIMHANPNVSRWLPEEGTEVVLPLAYILPMAPREGLVLNLPEMRLYLYGQHDKQGRPVVITYPASIGRMDWKSPLGETKVVKKMQDPTWYPTPSLRAEAAAEGDPLPEMVPPGPDNPLGRYALYLGFPGYLIHGVDKRKAYGIGMRVTHGCVRLYPEDVEQLFPMVPVGAKVRFVDQSVKLGWLADTLFIEVQPPLEESRMSDDALYNHAMNLIGEQRKLRPLEVDDNLLLQAILDKSGMPVAISR